MAKSTTSLATGQFISLLITATGVFSSLLANDGVDIPTVQSSLNYLLLSGHLLWAFPRGGTRHLAFPSWRYLLWAFCDVEGNYLVVTAYQYTSVASVMLLDCFTIPVVMVVSRILMGARYTRWHILACCICIVGLSLTVLSDALLKKDSGASTPQGPAWFGDVLVLLGATLYGFSNVQQELIVKGDCRRSEALGMLGMWGTVLSFLQAAAVERAALWSISWNPRIVLCMLGFQLSLFGMYVLTSLFLQTGDAALFNLSLLTSDVYSVVFSWGVQHRSITWVYGVAFATTLTGLVVYHSQPPIAATGDSLSPQRDGLLLGVL